MDKIEDIINQLRTNDAIPPNKLATWRLQLSGEYAFIAQRLAEVQMAKPDIWLAIRERDGITSDAQADREWERTEQGKNERAYKTQLKYLEKIMSALRTRINVAEGEAYNQF